MAFILIFIHLTCSNGLVAVIGTETHTILPRVEQKVDNNECTPLFTGMTYCTALMYTDAYNEEDVPYFPFTGDSK